MTTRGGSVKKNQLILMLCSRCRFYWRLHPQMPEPEQTLIKSTWPSIPNKVDAAYENPEKDQVLIFSGGRRARFILDAPLLQNFSDSTSALCFYRDPDVGSEWIQPGGRLPEVHPQTGISQNSTEGGRCCAHRRDRQDSLLHR